MESRPRINKGLVVYAWRGHKVNKDVLGYIAAPRACGAQFNGLARIGLKDRKGCVVYIREGHGSKVATDKRGNVLVVDGGKAGFKLSLQRLEQCSACLIALSGVCVECLRKQRHLVLLDLNREHGVGFIGQVG